MEKDKKIKYCEGCKRKTNLLRDIFYMNRGVDPNTGHRISQERIEEIMKCVTKEIISHEADALSSVRKKTEKIA